MGLASHWPCVTDNNGLSTYRLNGLCKGDEHPSYASAGVWPSFAFTFIITCTLWLSFPVYDAKPIIYLKASDVVRQPKIADMSRGVIRDGNADSASRLRSSETAPDGIYSRNSADGDSVSIGIEWPGGDVRFFVIMCVFNKFAVALLICAL